MLILPLLTSALSFATYSLAVSTSRNPITALANIQNATIHTYNHRIHHHSHFDITLQYFDQSVKLSLQPNHDVIAEGAHFNVIDNKGNVRSEEPIDRTAHKVYKGTSWLQTKDGTWERAGTARIYVQRDGANPLFSGTFRIGRGSNHIQLSSNYRKTKHYLDPEIEDIEDEYMVLWRDTDVSKHVTGHSELKRDVSGAICNADSLSFNMAPEHPVYAKMLRRDESFWASSIDSLLGKRQLDTPGGGNSAGINLLSTIGKTEGCSTSRRVALVGVAADCNYMGDFNNVDAARQNIIDQMNSASDIYERQFNLTLGLKNLTTVDAECPASPPETTAWNLACSANANIERRLNLFSRWRGQQTDSNSHWTLLSTCSQPSERAVGLAWLGQACVSGSQPNGNNNDEQVAGANVVYRTNGGSTEWQVIAHETGHTFGAVHDCVDQTCNDGVSVAAQQCCPLSSGTCDARQQFIMNPSTDERIQEFSLCSIGNICSAFGRNSVNTNCFTNNRNVDLVTGQQCGNGIVEGEEECDCGGEAQCAGNRCCDPKTCRFTTGSVCDDSNDGCCRSCQFASANVVCRPSTGDCDPQETCPGNSSHCPEDVTTPDGDGCGDGLQCASGQCTSRDVQCKTVMGTYTQGNDTYACDADSCSISCASPEFGRNCYGLEQNFLDGTICQGNGRCRNGRCQGSSIGGQIRSWIDRNKTIVIGVAAGVGGLLLLMISCCIVSCCRKRRRNKKIASAPPRPMQQAQGYYGARNGPPVPPGAQYGNASVDGWNGPMPPPPSHQQHPRQRGNSVRYA